MATLLYTNLTSSAVPITELYTSVPASGTLSVSRPASAFAGMRVTQEKIAAGVITVTVTLTADEIASGFVTSPNSVTADDMAAVASTAIAAPIQTFRKAFTATGATGTKVDVTLFAANALPYKFRILDAVVLLATNQGGTTCELRDEAAGAGTSLVSFATAVAGPNRPSVAFTASQLVSQSTTAKGLFLNYDRFTAGEVIVTVRREV